MGTRPPYLAGRENQIRLFERLLEDYPEKRRNLRITGLRGVGKTVLLKEYERLAKRRDWVVVRRDWGPRLREEADFATAISEYLREAVESLSVKARMKKGVSSALTAIGQVQVQIGGEVTVSVGPGVPRPTKSILEDRLRVALTEVGSVARSQGRGVALLFDEAHSVHDRPGKHQYPLGALLSAMVAVQDEDEEPLPVMLVLCGLQPLTANIHAARSNAERLFRAGEVGNLPLIPASPGSLSAAAQALVRPADTIAYADGVAERVAGDVSGYPYFVQWFGEALWDAADLDSLDSITHELYERERPAIQRSLDNEFFEPRYRDARRADQRTVRVAASLGGEGFTKVALDAADTRTTGALAVSLNRLIADNLVYRDEHGVYAYTAPLFGNFMRRRHPCLPGDR
ncbi:MAG TPA: ATP-binding protein [Solirubrobacteraceae bacterium]|nr:ATP-binding protein [Solirubrobacteraceae bacterium]